MEHEPEVLFFRWRQNDGKNKEELMMNTKKKRTRLWSILLALVMLVGLLPTTALAGGFEVTT